MRLSLAISFGVVPEEISAWNPLIAPHAMVMKQNGKILPAKIGPGAVDEARERRQLELRPDEQDAEAEQDARRRA